MTIKPIAIAIMAVFASQSVNASDDINEQIKVLQQRIKYLEQRSADQDKAVNKVGEAAAVSSSSFNIGGVIEVELSAVDVDGEDNEASLDLATAELAIEANPTDNLSAELVMLYEDNGDSSLDIDSVSFTYTNDAGTNAITAGQFYFPFGVYDTSMVSDPITLDIGEIREEAVMTQFSLGSAALAAYIFKGPVAEDGENSSISNFGLTLGQEVELGSGVASYQISYINSLSQTDGLSEVFADGVESYVPGVSLAASMGLGAMTLIGEVIMATDSYASTGTEPSAYNLEVAYGFDMGGREATLGLAVQGSDEAEGILPESKTLVGFSTSLRENVDLGVEYSNAEDYDGTEESAFVAQVAVSF